jgi:hypothetical protein
VAILVLCARASEALHNRANNWGRVAGEALKNHWSFVIGHFSFVILVSPVSYP